LSKQNPNTVLVTQRSENTMTSSTDSGANGPGPALWKRVLDDMEATADEYKQEGWTAVMLHPGSVQPLLPSEASQKYGIDIVVPVSEYEETRKVVSDRDDEAQIEVLCNRYSETLFSMLVYRFESDQQAILCPFYLSGQDSIDLLELAINEECLPVYIRSLSETPIKVSLDDPEVLVQE